MTTRRTFVAGSLAAAAALALPFSARAQSRSARIRTKDSAELHVKEWGTGGRTVIFTHAWPLSADIWDYQAVALAEAGYRVLAYDRRGFGRSSQPAAGYDFDTMSDDRAAALRRPAHATSRWPAIPWAAARSCATSPATAAGRSPRRPWSAPPPATC